MAQLLCPIEGCEWKSQKLDEAFAAALNTALQGHIDSAHGQGNQATAKPEKLSRPTISRGCTNEDWGYFKSQWNSYKRATKLSDADINVQLLACCDPELRRDLHRTDNNLEEKTENKVLEAIQALSVKRENVMVARLTLHNLTQDRDESVRNFAARLRGQADVCQFSIKCQCGSFVHYTDPMIRDVLIRGLCSHEIQQDILGHENQEMKLEEVIKLIEAKEAGRRSQMSMMTEEAHGISQYVKHKNEPIKAQNSKPTLPKEFNCERCKKQFIRPNGPGGKPRPYKLCKQCFMEQKQKPNTPKEESCEVFDMICYGKNKSPRRPIKLTHHIFNNSEGWIARRSLPQPVITVTARVCMDDYEHFGASLKSTPTGGPISAVADTGCQSCLIGAKIVYGLGFRKDDFLEVEHQMAAVNKHSIKIIGAVLLRLCSSDKDGHPLQSAQICYITTDTDKMFLSREACVDLGLISSAFPSLGEARQGNSTYTARDTGNACSTVDDSHGCDCPRRSLAPPRPKSLPFPATEDNVAKLKKWLLDHYASSTFNTCPHSQLPSMSGPPLSLMVDPDAKPVAVHTPIPVPLHWQEKVKAGLDRDVSLGVIEPVPVGEPVTWCHRMVVTRKKNGDPRRTVDLQALNAHCVRETHHTPSPFHQARTIPSGKKKSVFDAWNGYHSVPIRECDRHLTTFITPWGRYRYRTTPQGYIASGDGYTRRFDEIVSSFPNKTKCIDDTCMWSNSIEECFSQACEWLEICGNNGIILNPEKFQFAQDVVEFAGFEITPDKVKPCNRYIDAISQFPTPTNITDVRSWFGLVNQVSYYASMSDNMRPFRDLLKSKSTFYWDSQLQQLFEESKRSIVSAIQEGVQIFDKGRKTCLATDWSKEGLGFLLLQKHCECSGDAPFCCTDGWKVTLVGSRFTHPAESRYAPIEGEALAVADALERTRYFTLGCNDLIVAVDHQPLLKVLGDRKLENIKNPRLFNLKEKTLAFKFKIIHIPGRRHIATDAVSRHPTGESELLTLPDDEHAACVDQGDVWCTQHEMLQGLRSHLHEVCIAVETDNAMAAMHSLDDLQAVTWDRVREATMSDPIMFELMETIEDGMPDEKLLLPPALREYHALREYLSTTDGVVLYKDRIIIPPSLRSEVLNALHAAHQGVTAMTTRADISVFWPGITTQISALRSQCNDCNRSAPSNPSAPPTPLTDPAFPFQCICADYFTYKGMHYLIIVDRYSNWPIIKRAKDGASGLIKSLREEFVTYGIPEEMASDGGPEFTAATTQEFLRKWGVKQRISSVAFPHSNCRAELGVKTCKRLIMNNTGPNGELDVCKFQRAVLQYRNAPDQDTKMSPAMIVFGRSTRDFIPVKPGRYIPQSAWRDNQNLREMALRKRHTREQERLTEHTRILPPLRVGDHVRIQNQVGKDKLKWDRTGIVVEVRQYDQYVIRIDGSGRVTLRNRRFLRKFSLYEPSRHCPVPNLPSVKSIPQVVGTPRSQELPPASPPPPASPSSSSVSPTECFSPNSTEDESKAIPDDANKSTLGCDSDHTTTTSQSEPVERPKRNRRPPDRYDPSHYDKKR